METTIWLFRHAQSEMNTHQGEYVGGRSNGTPLTPEGKAQAWKLGLWIARNKLAPDVVYASPAKRTLQTGRLSLKAAGIRMPLIEDFDVQEMSQGDAEGMLRQDVYTKEVLEQIQSELMDFKLPGGESMNDVADRGYDRIESLRQLHAGETTFIYTHGFFVRCLVGRYLDWDHTAIRSNDVDNAAATRLVFRDGEATPGVAFNLNTQSLGEPMNARMIQ